MSFLSKINVRKVKTAFLVTGYPHIT